MMVKKQSFEKLDGFDENFQIEFGDVNVGVEGSRRLAKNEILASSLHELKHNYETCNQYFLLEINPVSQLSSEAGLKSFVRN